MFCRFCGKEIENDSLFCRHCGQSLGYAGNFTNFLRSIEKRVATQDTGFLKDKQGHLCLIVISKDQLSISIVEEDVNKIDLYDCFAIIALLRYDTYSKYYDGSNTYSFHYNHFFNLGFYDENLNPISKLVVNGYSIEKVDSGINSHFWGCIKGRNKYGECVVFHIGNNTKLIKWE